MFSYCLFLYFLGTSACIVAGTVANEAIIGGYNAGVNQFPYHVTLMNDGKDECGGAIIGNYFVLTAAHCILNDGQFRDRRHLTIVAGMNNLKKRYRYAAVTVKVNKVFVPKEFTGSTAINATGDIAVLKLKRSLKLSTNKHLQQLELPINKHETYAGKTATITGFGWDYVHVYQHNHIFGGKSSTKLQYANADVLSNKECQEDYADHNVVISKKEMCARIHPNPHDDGSDRYGSCIGDSGGPLVNNGTTIIGILSKSSSDCSEKTKATIYTRVSDYLKFIESAMHDQETLSIQGPHSK